MTSKLKLIGLLYVVCFLLTGCSETERRKEELLREVEKNFENPEALFELGQLYQDQRQWDLSEYYYDMALGFDPSYRDMQAVTVKSLKESNDPSRAQSTADIYIRQVGSSALESLRLGMAFQKQGLDDYALSCYRQSLSLYPNSARVNREIGYFYLLNNDNNHAKEYLVRSFQLNPKQREVARDLGQLGVPMRIP